MVAFSMIVAARLAASSGDWSTATTLHGHAELILETTGIALYDADQRLSDEMLKAAREQLGEDAFASARADGQALGLPEVAAVADGVLSAAATQ